MSTPRLGGRDRVGVGDPAPGFTLPGTDGTAASHRDVSLSDWAGRPVVLVFYPGDGTPVCTRQLNSYTTGIEAFRDVDAALLAISPQSLESHDRFSAEQHGFAFPLLADEDRAVGRAYGVLGPVGYYRRSLFVVDGSGTIRYAHRAVAGQWFRPPAELVAAVAAAG
ncbi:MAG TPA: peroxiredoxin [Acidimicrobiales bacterium]|nr:peroxiredoxin [Acidimicrobiales bacterium]